MGGELSEVGTTGHQETGASCNAPTQLTISCLLPCNRIYIMRFGLCRTAKSGKGFYRCGVTITR